MIISLDTIPSICFITYMLSVVPWEVYLGLLLLFSCDLVLLYLFIDLVKRVKQMEEIKAKRVSEELQKQRESLLRKEVETQEEERKRIGCDLHDMLSNQLCLILLKLNADYTRVQMERDIRTVLLAVRDISYDLNPLFQSDSPLHVLIIYQFEKLRPVYLVQKNIRIYKKRNETVQYKIMVVRVIQELITNIIKHAKATEVQLMIRASFGGLYISIEDNGIGQSRMKQGQGYRNIQNRLLLLNGHFKIKTKTNCGTKIIVLLKDET